MKKNLPGNASSSLIPQFSDSFTRPDKNVVTAGSGNYNVKFSPDALAKASNKVKTRHGVAEWSTSMLRKQLELSWDTKERQKITSSETGISRIRVMRNAVFVAGEAGVGKTELLRKHAADLAARYGARYQEWSALSWKERDKMMIWASGIDDPEKEIDPKTGEVKEELYQTVQQRLLPYLNGEESVSLRDFVLIAIDTPQMLPGALKGIPNLSEVSRLYLRTTVDSWQYYSSLPRSAGIILFDELTSTSSEVLKEFHSLLLSGSTYETQLSNYWQIVAAGNLNTDDDGRAADLYDAEMLSTALANRLKFGWFFPSVDAWVRYARNKGVVSFLIDFVQIPDENGNFINFIDEPSKRGERYANPRNLVRFSNEIEVLLNKYQKLSAEGAPIDTEDFWEEFINAGIGIVGEKFTNNLVEYLRLRCNFNIDEIINNAFESGDPFDITKTSSYKTANEKDKKRFNEMAISYGYQVANFISSQCRDFIDELLHKPIDEIASLPSHTRNYVVEGLDQPISVNLIKMKSGEDLTSAINMVKILLCASQYNVVYNLNVDAAQAVQNIKDRITGKDPTGAAAQKDLKAIASQLKTNDIKNKFPDIINTIIANGIQEPLSHYFSLVFLGIKNKYLKGEENMKDDIKKSVEKVFPDIEKRISNLNDIKNVLDQKLRLIQGILFSDPYDEKELLDQQIDNESIIRAIRINFIWYKIVKSILAKTFFEINNSMREMFIDLIKKNKTK